MKNQIWLNLASSNLDRTRSFYEKVGARINDKAPPNLVSVLVGKDNLMVNFFSNDEYSRFVKNSACDSKQSNEVVFSIGVDKREEVDQWAKSAKDAGGDVFSEPLEVQGWMYSCSFSDPDGHNWNVLFMDMSKAPK